MAPMPAKAGGPPCPGNQLFDGHSEPSDQPRDLVQMLGIVLGDGAIWIVVLLAQKR